MQMTIPKEIIWAAISFAKIVQQHSQASDSQIEQMFDAFDPALKRHVLMQMLNTQGVVRRNSTVVQKIQAIKAVRMHIGCSLREASDLIEQSETESGAKLPLNLSPQVCESLSRELAEYGYKVT
jgi:ribosomal protein L7/L12